MIIAMCSLLEEQILGSTHSVLSVCLHDVDIKTKTELSISGMEEGTVFSPLSQHFLPLPLRKLTVLMLQEGRVTPTARWVTDKPDWQTRRKYLAFCRGISRFGIG